MNYLKKAVIIVKNRHFSEIGRRSFIVIVVGHVWAIWEKSH